MKREEREAARQLRQDEGMPLNAIALRLGVSKSSVSRWIRGIELSPEQHAVLRQMNPIYNSQLRGQEGRRRSARAARLEAQEHGRVLARRGEPLHLQGCMLYWAEGSKTRNVVAFTNSDPDMLEVFLRFLRNCYALPDEKVALAVNCHLANGLGADAIVGWWLQQLGLPASCARAPTINRPSPASRGRRGHVLPYGTARLSVCSTYVVQSIYGAIQEYAGIERTDWVDLP